MSDIMTPIPFDKLMGWILSEKGSLFGVKRFYRHEGGRAPIFGESLEVPAGPAAGPHTQLAQNIIAAYVAGARFFELKTVQTLDGPDLPVSKPCILANDEGYNVEWSTELRVGEAMNEYIKAWFALKLLSRELMLGDENGFVFNMSVGYDLEGIKSPKIDGFIEGLKNAGETAQFAECRRWALANAARFKNIDEKYIESVPPLICSSITLSTLHGCPREEIERIAAYLITEKKLNTFIKCNPTLLGYEFARKTLDSLGYGYISFDDHHFKEDLQYSDAVPMIRRLMALAEQNGLEFGVKLTNTFPVDIAGGELPGDEMYMSGRSLFPLSIALAARLSAEFDGSLRISYSGGADALNIAGIIGAGIYPVTLATTLLKPGGYERLTQIAKSLCGQNFPLSGVNTGAAEALAKSALLDKRYKKPVKPLPTRKNGMEVPLFDCAFPPCSQGCPIGQDIPQYIRLSGEGRYLDSLKVIADRNPLPFITGTICAHRCMTRCRRNFYDDSVAIREAKLISAKNACDALLAEDKPQAQGKGCVAIIGAGAAGLAAAYYLTRAGLSADIFEKRESAGGVVRYAIPSFRINSGDIERDVALCLSYGARLKLGAPVESVSWLKERGYKYVIIAVGAWQSGELKLKRGEAIDALEFLEDFNAGKARLGKNVVVVGGGNTAMDAARAAKRVSGVQNVSIVYRRDERNMPADEEELVMAMEEGVVMSTLKSPVSLENGKLICEVMKLGEKDDKGRRSPVPTGELTSVEADSVIAAVGERVEGALFDKLGVALDKKGRPVTNNCEAAPGVFVAGDALAGPATVVEAMADAMKVCAQIITREGKEIPWQSAPKRESSAARLKKGVLIPYQDAGRESERCLECDTACGCCIDVCPNRANVGISTSEGPQILHMDPMCNECGNCATFCPYQSAPYKDKFTYFKTEADFDASQNDGFTVLDAATRRCKIRVDGQVSQGEGEGRVAGLIAAVLDNYGYLL